MSTSNDFVADDTGCTLSATCTDKISGMPINLTGATVNLNWMSSANVAVTKTMVIDSVTKGKVSYKFLTGELYAPLMKLEVVVTDAASKKITSLDEVVIKVRARITP